MALTNRLELILSLVRPGENLWDLGCDHGYLGLSALEQGIVPCVYFVDPVYEVIERLKRKTKSHRSRSSMTFQSAKAQELDWKLVTGTVVFCGLGAKNIIKGLAPLQTQICAQTSTLGTSEILRLILGPQNQTSLVFETLTAMAVHGVQECKVQERDHSRHIFCADIPLKRESQPVRP